MCCCPEEMLHSCLHLLSISSLGRALSSSFEHNSILTAIISLVTHEHGTRRHQFLHTWRTTPSPPRVVFQLFVTRLLLFNLPLISIFYTLFPFVPLIHSCSSPQSLFLASDDEEDTHLVVQELMAVIRNALTCSILRGSLRFWAARWAPAERCYSYGKLELGEVSRVWPRLTIRVRSKELLHCVHYLKSIGRVHPWFPLKSTSLHILGFTWLCMQTTTSSVCACFVQ